MRHSNNYRRRKQHHPRPSQNICVKTAQGNIAIITVKQINTAGDTVTSILVHTTVWSNRIAAPYSPGRWPKKRWSGRLLFSDGNVQLDSIPPNVNTNSGSPDLTLVENKIQPYSAVAVWNDKGSPTARACATLIITEGASSITPRPSQNICVKTAQGNIAIITVKQINTAGGTVTSILVHTTVWSK